MNESNHPLNSSCPDTHACRLAGGILTAVFLAACLLAGAASCTFPELLDDQAASTGQPVAIFYGIRDYPGTANDLQRTGNDATAMAAYFASLGWETNLVLDSACTQAKFSSLVQTIAAASTEGRRVLFFYAGHGYGPPQTADKSKSYIIWWSASGTFDWISPSIFQGLLQPLLDKKLRVSLVLDSCNSGGFVFDAAWVDSLPWDFSDTASQGEGSKIPTDLRAFLEWFAASTTADSDAVATQTFDPDLVWSMSAAGYGEESWESSEFKDREGLEHGIFTWAFLKGMENDSAGYLAADRNRDGFTSFRELYAFARDKVAATWNARGKAWDSQDFMPHISGNYTDIMLFTR